MADFAMTFRGVLLRGVAFVALGGIAKRAIKKVTDQPDEFLLLVEFHGGIAKAASAEVFEQTLSFPWDPVAFYAGTGMEWGFGIASWLFVVPDIREVRWAPLA